jgi:hypothetical protein
MPGFQYNIPKVHVLYREVGVARSVFPLIVGVGVETNLNCGLTSVKLSFYSVIILSYIVAARC